MIHNELPKGWVNSSLEEICHAPQYGWTTRAVPNGKGLKLLRTTDISQGDIDWDSVPSCEQKPKDANKYLIGPGDILVSRAGSVGISYLIRKCPPAVFASYLIRFRPNKPIPSNFIALYLKTSQYWSAIADETLGIAVPNVNASKLKRLSVPVPPLAEQRRIVAKVEELLARVSAARERLAKVQILLKRFRQSVLAAACSGRLTEDWRERRTNKFRLNQLIERIRDKRRLEYENNCAKAKNAGKPKPFKPTNIENFELAWTLKNDNYPKSWAIKPLGETCKKITDGTHNTPKPTKEGIPYITAKHIRERIIDFDDSLHLPYNTHKAIFSRCNPEKDDVVMVNIGAGTATPALVNVDFEFSMKNVALLKPDPEIISGQYLEFYQLYIKPLIFNIVSRGGAQPFMGLNLIKTIPIVIPPLDEQQEIVSRVDLLFDLVQSIEERIRFSTTRAEKLSQSILARAFRGELVPTEAELARQEGRDYEPASVLLKRIKTEREKTESKPKKTVRRKRNG